MARYLTLAAVVLVLSIASLSGAAEPALGSPTFKPTPDQPIGWRGDGTGRFPASTPPLAWERKRDGAAYATRNILWMTRMPMGSIASPIIVGDRVFICSDNADLMCLDKRTGRILWMQSNGYFEAARDSDRENPDFKAKVLPLAEEVRKTNEKYFEQANALISPAGPNVAQEDAFNELTRQKRDKEAKLYDAMRGIDAQRYAGQPYRQHCGTSNGTPCSDGKYVWATFLGGVSGPASMTVVCYDLDGKRQWMQMIEGIKAPEHGNHSSMLLVGSRLIFMGNDLTIAFDKESGKELWRAKGPGYTDGIAVPRAFKIDGEDVIFRAHSEANILRVADGKVISTYKNIGWLWSTPTIENGVAFYGDRNKDVLVCAVQLPQRAGEKPKELYKVAAPAGSKSTEVVASPLVYGGLVYSISEGGMLAAVDAQTGQPAYFATPYTANVKWVFAPGVCASPTLAGNRIYLMGDTGTAIVLEPGRSYKVLATNVLEEKPLGGFNFLGSPWFEGKCMYYRSGCYLYCIGEK